MKLILTILFSLTLVTSSAFAQGDKGGNGGKTLESDFFTYVRKIERFLHQTNAAKKFFTEVDADQYSLKVNCLHVNASITRPIDKFAIERDAVNYPETCTIDVSQKAWDAMEKTPQKKFAFVFHEMLGLMKLELPDPITKTSNYKISSRLSGFVRQIQDYDLFDLPALKINEEKNFRITCQRDRGSFTGAGITNTSSKDIQVMMDLIFSAKPTLEFGVQGKVTREGKTLAQGDRKVYPFYYNVGHTFDAWKDTTLIASIKTDDRFRFYSITMNYTPQLVQNEFFKRLSVNGTAVGVSWQATIRKIKLIDECKNCQMWPQDSETYPMLCGTEVKHDDHYAAADADELNLLRQLMNKDVTVDTSQIEPVTPKPLEMQELPKGPVCKFMIYRNGHDHFSGDVDKVIAINPDYKNFGEACDQCVMKATELTLNERLVDIKNILGEKLATVKEETLNNYSIKPYVENGNETKFCGTMSAEIVYPKVDK